ncbi:MAG: DegT/DnrJ/EryC1/StrS family aminotransferase [Clostridia bacterium]|nr:DegT/DnrJ/EryC1/StrS family aminotransferase [Clostridia bacterium]
MYKIGREEAEAASRVIESGELFRIGGKYREVIQFEEEFKKKVGAEHCLLMTNGTQAIAASLAALGIGPGDEVIVPGYTFIATAIAVLSVGAIPVVAEIDESLTIDPDDVEKKISRYTKAIVPVHMVGFPCNMKRIMEIAEKYNLYVVEDACQACGGQFGGRYLGTFGNFGAFSFNFFKILTAGEGGALITNDIKKYERAIIYHDCGTAFWSYEQPITEPLFSGANMRSNEITGAILRVQLTRLDDILSHLRGHKRKLMDMLKDVPGIRFNRSNDINGDCGTWIPFIFDTVEQAEKFEHAVGGSRPINTGKHVYENWVPILEKRGAHCDAMNPYRFPLNAGLNMDVSRDSCPKILDYLSRTVYIGTSYDMSDEYLESVAEKCVSAVK